MCDRGVKAGPDLAQVAGPDKAPARSRRVCAGPQGRRLRGHGKRPTLPSHEYVVVIPPVPPLAYWGAKRHTETPRGSRFRMAYAAGGLLDSISEFCRRAGMAESTFGRRA